VASVVAGDAEDAGLEIAGPENEGRKLMSG